MVFCYNKKMQLDEVKVLAEKANISIEEKELQSLTSDFDKILTYVSHINDAGISELNNSDFVIKNVYRDDVVSNKNSEFSKDILDNMPDTQDGFLKVNKIL